MKHSSSFGYVSLFRSATVFAFVASNVFCFAREYYLVPACWQQRILKRQTIKLGSWERAVSGGSFPTASRFLEAYSAGPNITSVCLMIAAVMVFLLLLSKFLLAAVIGFCLCCH